MDHPLFLAKKRVREHLEEIELPYTHLYIGLTVGPLPDTICSWAVSLAWVSFPNRVTNSDSLGGILPAVKSLAAPVPKLSPSTLVRTSRGS